MSEYPMIPVPQAVLTVLKETALTALTASPSIPSTSNASSSPNNGNNDNNKNDTTKNNNNNHDTGIERVGVSNGITNRTSAQDVEASEPGYPKYNVSIMDGYAICRQELQLYFDSIKSCNSKSDIDKDNGIKDDAKDGQDDCDADADAAATTTTNSMTEFQVVNKIYAGPPSSSSGNDKSNNNLKEGDEINNTTTLPTAIYVTTGAFIPSPYDAVIPIEQIICQQPNNNNNNKSSSSSSSSSNNKINTKISISTTKITNLKVNTWIRPIGCDIPPKTRIVNKGDVITSVQIGLLLQCGVEFIDVYKVPKVGLLSTGNELYETQPSSTPLTPTTVTTSQTNDHPSSPPSSQDISSSSLLIPDINRPMLQSLLSSYQNNTIMDLGILSDDSSENHIKELFIHAIDTCDVIITTGGISMGEKDIMEHVFTHIIGNHKEGDKENEITKIHFGRLHMKPGKPTTFCTIDRHFLSTKLKTDNSPFQMNNCTGKCLIFAMPGNPVSAHVCTELLVRPCLDLLYHHGPYQHPELTYQHEIAPLVQNAIVHGEVYATLTSNVKLDVERPEYHRVKLSYNHYYNPSSQEGSAGAMFTAVSTGVQRSSRVLSLCHADGFMVLPQGQRGGKVVAQAGEVYPVLLIRRASDGGIGCGMFGGIPLKQSMHLHTAKLAVGIIEVYGQRAFEEHENNDDMTTANDTTTNPNLSSVIAEKVTAAIGDEALIVQSIPIQGMTETDEISNTIHHGLSKSLDILLIVGIGLSFRQNLDLAHLLRTNHVTKEAETIELQIRQGAVNEHSLSALFEPVVGLDRSEADNPIASRLIMSVPFNGLCGALKNVKVLLRPALKVARGL